MQTPHAAAGAAGVASRPAWQRLAPDVRLPQRDLLDPEAGSSAERLADHLTGRHPATVAAIVTVVGYAFLTAAMVGLGLFLTKIMFDGASGGDAALNRWFEARRTPTWDDVSRYGSMIADTLTVVGIAALVAFVLGCRRCWREISFLAIALLLEVTVFVSVAFLVSRERPPVLRLDEAPPTSSFPSGHTAASVVLYGGLALIITAHVRNTVVRAVVWTVAVCAPLFVGTARLYRGMHFPSDVASGALLGVACLLVALFAVRAAVGVARREEVTS
jgi:undecaprenyl-diphosphatase